MEQFQNLGPANGNFSEEQAKRFMLQSPQPPPALGQIWSLADSNADRELDLKVVSITSKTYSRDGTSVFLYKIVAEDEFQLVSISKPYKQRQLSSDDVFALDTPCSGVFLWLGSDVDEEIKQNYHLIGQKYLEVNDYPSWVPVTMVSEGSESSTFRQYFQTWDIVIGYAQNYISDTDAGYCSGDAEELAAVAKLLRKRAAARRKRGALW